MMTKPNLGIYVSADERRWLLHAASLRHISLDEYIRRALNESLIREGVDALLIMTKEDRDRKRNAIKA